MKNDILSMHQKFIYMEHILFIASENKILHLNFSNCTNSKFVHQNLVGLHFNLKFPLV